MKKDLLHRKNPDEIYESVNELASYISNLKVLLELTGGTTHFSCFDGDLNYFKSNVEKVMSEIESPVLDSYRVHIKVQRGEKG
jgi:fructose-1,6-bisphosphatase